MANTTKNRQLNEGDRSIVIVAGMHRSGTSMITRILSLMGCDLPKNLMGAFLGDNDKGFWESSVIRDFNNEILESAGSTWDDWRPIDPDWYKSPVVGGFKERAQSILLDQFGDSRLFILKDPRVCRLLPFWTGVARLIGAKPLIVIPMRNPLNVAASLNVRDGIDLPTGHLIWLRHVLDAEAYSRGLKRAYILYKDAVSDPMSVIHTIGEALDIVWPKASSVYSEIEINDFVSPELQRHTISDDKLISNQASLYWLRSTFEIFSRWARGETRKEDMTELDRIRSAFDEATLAFSRTIAISERRVAGRKDRITELESMVSGRDSRVLELEAAVLERDGRLLELESAVSARDDHVSELESTISELNHGRNTMVERIKQQDEEVMRLRGQLEATQIHVQEMSSSTSWKITFPLREVKRWLMKPGIRVGGYPRVPNDRGRALKRELPLGDGREEIGNENHADERLRILRGSDEGAHTVVGSRLPASESRAAGIHFPPMNHPIVSVIIPIYGNCKYTLQCLNSISANMPSVPFEVIIVDDKSPDDSVEVMKLIENIRLISNSENKGFIRSCNRGAKEARGKYLCFLNNDTEVVDGWLDELVRTFYEIPGTGLVGSKLVYPDGRLQEAGGIIWRDGSAWNFGHGQDIKLPVYNYAREVDYCSGASIMIPKLLFDDLGGFDEHYIPAYCEDSDLALKVRSIGYGVIYQPYSVVVHHEGITSGTDLTHGVKSYQVTNSKKLYNRWQAMLADYQEAGKEVDRAKDRAFKHRVLILDTRTPTPDKDAGSVTIVNMMYLLKTMGFQVTFIPEDNFLYMPDYTVQLQRTGIETLYHPYCSSVEQHLREYGPRYDLIFLFRGNVADRHLDSVRKYSPNAKTIFLPTDLHYIRMQREASIQGDVGKQKAAQEMKQRELHVIRLVDASMVLSLFEQEELAREVPDAKVYIGPLAFSSPSQNAEPFSSRHDIAFVGGYQHPPNIDAVEYFVQDIMPVLRTNLPGVNFHIVGSNMPEKIRRLATEDIIATGFVEDLPDFLNRIRIFVCPLRYGAGVKGKIGTAMSIGLPVITTSIGVEGTNLVHGKNVLVADEPKAFVDNIKCLYNDELQWDRLSAAGLSFFKDAWAEEASWRILKKILEDIGFSEIDRGPYPLKVWTGKDYLADLC